MKPISISKYRLFYIFSASLILIFTLWKSAHGAFPEPVLSSVKGQQNYGSDHTNVELEKAAENLFKEVRKSYKNKKYWEALTDLIIVLDSYPGFTKFDEGLFYLANCLYEMEMYDGSEQMYRYLLRTAKKPKIIVETILGLQKVTFQKGEYQQSLKFYKAIESNYADYDIIYESRYFSSQTHFKMKDYDLVLNLMPHMKKKNKFYPFALYTSALTHLKKKRVRRAIEQFLEITRFSDKNRERKDIINSARLTLGYIHFELSNYKRALKYLKEIPDDFFDYPEALLVMGWSSLKLEDYPSTIKVLSLLEDNYSDYYNFEEIYFMKGQSYLKLKHYDLAINEFDKLINQRQDSLAVVDETRNGLTIFEQRIDEITKDMKRLESALIDIIPYQADVVRSAQQSNGFAKMEQTRESLLNDILAERQEFHDLSEQMANLERRIQLNEMRKKWMAYAEYGKVRALFFRNTESK